MLKKISLLMLLGLVLFVFCGCEADQSATGSDDTRVITDLAEREVAIPVNPSRIAAMTGPSYEMVFMLGGHDRIVMTKSGHTTNYPLALLTNPDLANYEGIGANPSSAVNIEDYLRRDIDLVIYYNNANELKKFEAVDLPAVVLTLNTSPITTVEDVMAQSLDDYISASTIAVETLADILGGEAVAEAEAWAEYCSEKLTMLYERTHELKDDQRPIVFWGTPGVKISWPPTR